MSTSIAPPGFTVPQATQPEKTCPKCAESVLEAAEVCRYCRHEFVAQSADAVDDEHKGLITAARWAMLLPPLAFFMGLYIAGEDFEGAEYWGRRIVSYSFLAAFGWVMILLSLGVL